MDGKQIHNYLKGPCGEVFGTYIIIGFRADNGKPLITGNAGHPVDQASQNKFLGEVSNYSQKKIVKFNQDKKRNAKED